MNQPIFWVLFNIFVAAMLALDLAILHRRPRPINFREALAWTGMWIALAGAFAVLVYFWRGRIVTLEFVTGYVIELSLSVDNLFVFLVIFRFFKVSAANQHKVLFWGILGALLMRGLFIALGVGLIRSFQWVSYVFGAFLVYSGLKFLREEEAEVDPGKNPVLKLFRRCVPVTSDYVGSRFFVRDPGLYATPLFVVLLVIESSDILFAVDSVPAILAITLNAFIVYTSNVFAILGLRSMYFALRGMIELFHYLHYGLSAVLILIGAKMLVSHYYRLRTDWALACVGGLLGGAVLASILFPKNK
ncbi:MAG: TerC family protein [Acidobacteria bacterium]|nr:TerC family protein [Acidobacteriota bacterium]